MRNFRKDKKTIDKTNESDFLFCNFLFLQFTLPIVASIPFSKNWFNRVSILRTGNVLMLGEKEPIEKELRIITIYSNLVK